MTVMEDFETLLKAAVKADYDTIMLAINRPEVLLVTTTQNNTFLHIACICGHNDIWAKVLKPKLSDHSVVSLLSATNADGETPLLTAMKSGRVGLASDLLDEYCEYHQLNEALLKQDRHGCNVLHHAIRNGYEKLALTLIEKQPALARYPNNNNESPMFIAVLRPDCKKVYMKLLDTEGSVYGGSYGYTALHAAVKYNQEDFVQKLFGTCTEVAKVLVRKQDSKGDTPVRLAAHYNRDKMLKVMLTFDRSLGYENPTEEVPFLFSAARRGHVGFARELLEHCPDANYRLENGRTCLHDAVYDNRMKFVEFILEEDSKLRKLINMQDEHGNTALHVAVEKSNPEMVSALLRHPDIDISVVNEGLCAAIWKLHENSNNAKSINWSKIVLHIFKKDDRAETDIYNLHEEIKNQVIDASRNDAKSLIKTYTGNTSLVAILIATITFAAAFTLPGGYSSSSGSEGLPIMTRKLAFQAFLIFDTLGMCSSLAVAFICVIARWMDFEFLLHYRFYTKKLMWFAYMATTLAFGTGLYTVLAPRLHWLAITICIISALLPILTMVIGQWPVMKLKSQYRKPFDSNFLDMV